MIRSMYLAAVLLFMNSFSFSHSETSHHLEKGDYYKVIKVLSKKTGHKKKEALKNKIVLADCYYRLFMQDSLEKTIVEIEKKMIQEQVKNNKLLSELFLIKSKFYIIIDDTESALKNIQKSDSCLSLEVNNKSIEFLPIYIIYALCYNLNLDFKNELKFSYKIEDLLNLNLNKKNLKKTDSIDAFFQLALTYQNYALVTDENKRSAYEVKSHQYITLAGKYAKNRRYFNIMALAHNGMLCEKKAHFFNKMGAEYSNKRCIRLGNYYYDKALYLCMQQHPVNPLIRAKIHFQKGMLNKVVSEEVAIVEFNKALAITIPKYFQSTAEEIVMNEGKIINKQFTLKLFSHKASAIYSLYKKTNNLVYLKNTNSAYLLSSFLLKKTAISRKHRKAYQLSCVNKIKLHESAIQVAYELFKKTKENDYKSHWYYFVESNKYSDILKLDFKSNDLSKKQPIKIETSMSASLLNHVQKKIVDTKTCVLEFSYDCDSNIYCMFITKRKSGIVKIDATARKIDERIGFLLSAIRKSNVAEFKSNSYYLYQKLVQPVLVKIGHKIDHLIIVPEKMITFVPFESLISSGSKSKDYRDLKYLIHKFTISNQLSMSIASYLNSKDQAKCKCSFLGMCSGNIKKMNRLTYSTRNIKHLKKTYDGLYFFDAKSTKENFIKYAPTASVIYLSAHAKANINQINSSKLFFNNKCTNKELDSLMVEDVYKLDLKANLVVLNACETGLGKYQFGEGIINFERAFFLAGCRSVVSTFWQTDDQGSSQILKEFIANLSQNKSLLFSLSHSKRNFLKKAKSSEDANPLYWAAYKLVGNERKIKIIKR